MKWMIPLSIRNGNIDEFEQASLMVKYASTIFQLTIGFPFILYYFGAKDAALVNLMTASLVPFSPLVMRITNSARAACHTLIFLLVAMIIGLALFMGGTKAAPLPVITAAPIAAGLLLGARDGVIWAGICVLLVVSIGLGELFGASFAGDFTSGQALFLHTAGFVTIIVAAAALMTQFDTVTKAALSEAQLANRRVAQMIEHVESTSEALSNSAADLLGVDDGSVISTDEAEGLTQQMMTTATAGRETLDSVGESLHGMIGHYRAISKRILNLHRHSGTIQDLVRTIDNISDRLDLMALNTGIEAAHVGEAGKRFRLLSDDMRRLAERVSGETTLIKAALRQVQSHTDAALDASLKGQSLTDDGTAKLDIMSQQFDAMYELIENTVESSKRMREDTRNQTTAIRHLARAGKGIA